MTRIFNKTETMTIKEFMDLQRKEKEIKERKFNKTYKTNNSKRSKDIVTVASAFMFVSAYVVLGGAIIITL